MMTVQIHNLPETATHKKWIVVRIVDGQAWFFSAWRYDQEAEARAQALQFQGLVVENTDWLKDVFKGVITP